jgi:hypothetical protein
MTDSQFRNQFLKEEEEKAIEADRYRRLPSWERNEQPEPKPGHDLRYVLKFLEKLGLGGNR